MKKVKVLSWLLCFVMVLSLFGVPVKAFAAGEDTIQSITLNMKSKYEMYVGTSETIKVKSVMPKGSSKKVTFASSDDSVVKVSKSGKILALKAGKATITVTSEVDTEVKKTVQITVKNLVKNTTNNKMVIALDKKKKTEKLSFTSKVKAVSLTFVSNKNKVAKVSRTGIVTGKKAGIAKITVKGKRGSVKKAKQVLTVYVADKSVKSAALNVEEVKLNEGEKFKLQVNVSPEEACNQSVFTSSNEEVATVDENGMITAHQNGTAVITATTIDGNKKAECKVMVGTQTNPDTSEQPGKSTTEEADKSGQTTTEKKDETDKPGETTTESTEADKPGEATTETTEEPKQPDKPVDDPADSEAKDPIEIPTPSEPPATQPVTLQGLEAKYPSEPNYPVLNLQDDFDMQVNLKDDLLSLNVEAGTIVRTNGYYSYNDGGQACYEIMTYVDWWNQLPIELKLVWYESNGLGNTYLYKNPVDNYGNHKLNNGMVAKLLPNKDGYVRVQQWGLFPDRKDNNRALIHIFANNHQNSRILFEKDAVYTLYYDNKTQAYQNKIGVKKDVPEGYNLDKFGGNGNEYALLLHCRSTSKPALGDAQNVELCGNGCTLKIPDNGFCTGPTDDFATIQLGGNVDGLKIHGFVFDSNGLNQFQYYDEATETYKDMITRNHTITYFSGGINVPADQVIKDGNGEQVLGDTKWSALTGYTGDTRAIFNNVEIYGNTFLANGTTLPIKDCGGDHILIINPIVSDNVNIHNNKMYNWGRWVFAIDLGGSGERFHNYSFKQNICIQDNSNVCYKLGEDGVTPTKTDRNRGLGWIDFEARKCFTNLDVSENYVWGANGWAFNGNGKISENVTINANYIQRGIFSWNGCYNYSFEFYSVFTKGLKITNNRFGEASINWGGLNYNTTIENNQFAPNSFTVRNPFGDVSIKNNVSMGDVDSQQSYNITSDENLAWVFDENSEFYVKPEDRYTNIVFDGNYAKYGKQNISATIIASGDDTDYRKNTTLTIKNGKFYKANLNCVGIKDLDFDPSMLLKTDTAWAARGCKHASTVVPMAVDNPVPGGLYYEVGDVIVSSLNNVTRLSGPEYFKTLFPQLKNEDGSIKKDMKMVCTKAGVFPMNGQFGFCDSDIYFTTQKALKKGSFVYTADNMYYVTVEGTTGDTEPTHVSGKETNGTAELLWVAPIGRYEMR